MGMPKSEKTVFIHVLNWGRAGKAPQAQVQGHEYLLIPVGQILAVDGIER